MHYGLRRATTLRTTFVGTKHTTGYGPKARSHTRNESSRSLCIPKNQQKASVVKNGDRNYFNLNNRILYVLFYYIKFAKVTNGLYLKQFPNPPRSSRGIYG